jgi:hypothetical protein
MADNILQSSYPSTPPRGFPGKRATSRGFNTDTYIATGDIAFGRAVGKDSGDRECKLGGNSAAFLGIAVSDEAKDGGALAAAAQGGSTPADKYVEGDNVAVANEGDWYILPGADVDPTDVVAYSSTTGIFGPHRLSATYDVVVEGAKFMDTTTSTSGDVARLRLTQAQGNEVAST